jgi:hypothetical protein
MILVVLAIVADLSPCWSSRICPVSLSRRIASLAVIAGGFPLTVRIGVGFGVGVGVKDMRVGVGVVPSKRRFPIGVNVRIGTRMMVLIEMNSRAIAIVRRIMYAPGWSSP